MKLADVEFRLDGQLLTAEITNTDGTTQNLHLALRSERSVEHEE
jgi:hypothetical protein